jgi:demethylmenaquinone methyltransferase/2-methoxy-6-polyprenyl-1,4-benzoquinol methylase
VVREFDPSTLRGRALVAAEHAIGFDSRFEGPDALADRMARAGLEPTVVGRGFGYTVAGKREVQ